jgi:hypothetical protein
MSFKVCWDSTRNWRCVAIQLLDANANVVMQTHMFAGPFLKWHIPMRKRWMTRKYAVLAAANAQ